jgi:hypothetical protein
MNTDSPTEATTTWQIVAELPFVDLQPAYEQVRKLRHVMVKPFDIESDVEIVFSYRGCGFRIVRCDDRLDILVNDPNCPLEVLLEPMTQIIAPLSRCSIGSHRQGE